jgi:light-independent protochlorophyllide reductase subunit B
MFREDFEFHGQAAPSHLGHASTELNAVVADKPVQTSAPEPVTAPAPATTASAAGRWTPEAERELGKIPFFVRSKARRNTERYALEAGVQTITVETLYDAKAHYSR